ncbi:MAG: metal-dependent transcriptional regulator [Halobacteriales archaeon]|nr:metal-dependent transcriptional regulator [Halobacteriales archaeon]
MLSDVMEDYLKAIYYLQSRADDDRVATSEIADYLDVTPPTVTSMIGKLDDRDLVTREKYKGVTLSPKGESVALEVLRHHRLLETYLTEQLDYDWSEVHDEADRLEHHISEEFERRVADALDDPEVDPHGDPIPTADLDPLDETNGTTLDEYDEGETVVIERVSDREVSELRYLAENGIEPGTRVRIVEIAPIGMITVAPEDTESPVSLPRKVARSVRVAPAIEGSM